jgi:hypothetical protein
VTEAAARAVLNDMSCTEWGFPKVISAISAPILTKPSSFSSSCSVSGWYDGVAVADAPGDPSSLLCSHSDWIDVAVADGTGNPSCIYVKDNFLDLYSSIC